jgi:DNA-directed RNA polymerase specialized sigma24 family protein
VSRERSDEVPVVINMQRDSSPPPTMTPLDLALQDLARRRRALMATGVPADQAEDILQDAHVRLLAGKPPAYVTKGWIRAVDTSARLDQRRRINRQRAAEAAMAVAQQSAEVGVIPASGKYREVEFDEPIAHPAEPPASGGTLYYLPPGAGMHPYDDPVKQERERLAAEAVVQVHALADAAGLADKARDAVIARYGLTPQPWAAIAKTVGVRRESVSHVVESYYQKMRDTAAPGVDVGNLIKRASYTERG